MEETNYLDADQMREIANAAFVADGDKSYLAFMQDYHYDILKRAKEGYFHLVVVGAIHENSILGRELRKHGYKVTVFSDTKRTTISWS